MCFVVVVSSTHFLMFFRHMLWGNMFETSLSRRDLDLLCILFRKLDAGSHSVIFILTHLLLICFRPLFLNVCAVCFEELCVGDLH